jgi:CRISPR-associated endonuclease Csn1
MTSKQDNLGPLTFGLDIGIASVGWAVLSESRIIDLGVRCFDKAETPEKGESLNLTRRTARLLRRRLRRRAWRLTKLARLLKREGLIASANLFKLKIEKNAPVLKSAWQLRVDALDRQLNAEEWARVIYHLCKHRGFHWISRAEEKAAESDPRGEGGKVKQGLACTKKLMLEKNYRTAAEMVLAQFPEAQRNKQGDYSKALSRILLGDELKTQFEHQRKLGNPFATHKLEAAILGNGDQKSGLFWRQNPALAGTDLLKMLGHCTFEKTEYRAPKASFTVERHVWLTRLNNLRIVVDGTIRSLNEAERRVALPMPYQQAGDLTYKQLRDALTKAGYLPESFRYTGISYASGQKADEKIKDPETAALAKIPAWQKLRKTLKDAALEDEWQKISTDALEGRSQLLDQIAWVLSVYKEGTEVETELRKLSLPNAGHMVDALLDIRFDKFSNLSLKALSQIVPLMEQGQRYDEAVANIQEYNHHSQLHKVGAGEHKHLPPFYKERDKTGRMVFCDDIPRNPVVLRALNQARKVVNALIKEYDSPYEVHIEMARDLSRPFDERKKVKTAQEEFRDRNEKDKALFAQTFNIVGAVKGKEFEKYQLYREQQGKCAYSIEPMDIHRLFEQGYAEIDHALAYSRSFDDSKNNRVLVLAKENRDKGNRTAYEYLTSFPGGESGERWRQFVAFVEGNKAYRLAKRSRLLRKDFGDKEANEFRERNLNDTRYICKFFKNYVEQYLQLHADSEAKHCVVLSGQMTSFLRARWGLIKVRGDSDRHHALDAVVVAACSHGMVKRLSDYSRRKELEQVRAGFLDVETGEIINPKMFDQLEKHFPNPWPHFRGELEARLKLDDPARLREEIQRLGTYSEDALQSLRPLFVSRAPQRRNTGAAHKDTIYAQPESLKAQGGVTQKVQLSSLTLKDLDKLIDPHRNEKLYAAIRVRLEQHGGKGEKAFPASNPLRKPDSGCNPSGPIVRGVTMVIDKLSGVSIRGGIAKNDSMVRVDVFSREKRFYVVPVYMHHTVAKALPNKAIAAHKDEEEWPLLDDGFSFSFSMYPNDLIRVTQKQGQIFGYYAGCDRGSGSINLWAHDRNKQVGKEGLIRGIGVKTALNIEKFNVDVLGNIYLAPPEKRSDLA